MPKAKSRTNPASKRDDEMTCVRSYARQEFRAVAGGEGDGDGEDDGIRSITGHPAVFNSPADIGGWFEEIIEPGAFDDCDLTDVLLFTKPSRYEDPTRTQPPQQRQLDDDTDGRRYRPQNGCRP